MRYTVLGLLPALLGVEGVDVLRQLVQARALQLVLGLVNQEAEDGQGDGHGKHKEADAHDGAGGLSAGGLGIVADDVQAHAGEGGGHGGGGLHQEGLGGAGDGLVPLAEFQLAVVDDVGDAAGGGAQGEAGAEEDEGAGGDDTGGAGGSHIAQGEQQHQAHNREGAGQKVDLLALHVLGDLGEEEEAHHFGDDGIAEDGVQVGVAAGLFKVVDGEGLQNLGAEVEGQQQADEGHQLVVLDDDGEGFLEAGLFRLALSHGGLFLDYGAGDADADDEQHHDGHGGVGEAGDGNVQHLAVVLGLHDGPVPGHFIEVVDEVQAEGAHQEAADGGEDAGDNGDGLPLPGVAGEVGQPGPVGHVHDGVGHAVEDIHDGHIDHQGPLIGDAAGGEKQDEEHGVDQGADDKPDTEFAVPGVGVVHNHAHHGVVDGVPNPGGAEEHAGKGRAQAQGIRHVQHQEGADEVADGILTDGADAEGVLLAGGKPSGLGVRGCHCGFLLHSHAYFVKRRALRLSISDFSRRTGKM